MDLFSVAGMYVFLWLTIWFWLSNKQLGALPWRMLFLPISLTACSSSSRSGIFWDFPYLHWHVNWWCYYSDYIWATTLLRFHECSIPITCRKYNLIADFLVLCFFQSFHFLFPDIPRPLGIGYVVDASTGQPIISSSEFCWPFDLLWLSVTICVCSKKKLLRRGMRATFICGHKGKNLECS